MARRDGHKKRSKSSKTIAQTRTRRRAILQSEYDRACELAARGDCDAALKRYHALQKQASDPHLKALVINDIAALRAGRGELAAAKSGFELALAMDSDCQPARLNLSLVTVDSVAQTPAADRQSHGIVPQAPKAVQAGGPRDDGVEPARTIRVAILSFLFNWPSTGGGIVHTVELAQFLGRAGFEVKHFYAQNLNWGVGKVEDKLPFPSEGLAFDAASWSVPKIQERFRRAVDSFHPDYVIVTDSWNSKPILAEAVQAYPYFMRFQALECLCPLNNVRLLPDGHGSFRQCHLHQLATPEECCRCLWERGRYSGSLHQAERALCDVGTREYHERLLRTLAGAEAVLVVNPLTEAMVSPYAKRIRVVTAGMDSARFPWPFEEEDRSQRSEVRSTKDRALLRLLFAGLVEEPMKGYEVLHKACELLWQRRQDFELVVTGDPPGQGGAFTRFVGWHTQEELPRLLRAADVFVFPTIAQEALGRTAVEAMAVGRPVVASRIGGLPKTVAEGSTGLLCEPGDPADLAQKIEILLNDPLLRERMGLAGRRRFEEHYTWDVIIERHYRPLLRPRAATT
jgi:glycosyltransferase involved in cell wall biosynthesis